jgi:hypothetical protein
MQATTRFSAKDAKLVETIAKNVYEERDAIQVIKVKAGVRATFPGTKFFDGLTEARARAIQKAVGYERPAKRKTATARRGGSMSRRSG